ncbi:hypothetical protein AGMMS49975_29900 [Clostridia bacterium]|nr:hypothetical protein AGMMS49975_29900 [Clostridia bacterium]
MNKVLNPIVYLQVHIYREFIKRHNLSINEFLALDEKIHLLDLLREGYEPFHLTGTEGVLEEIDEYCKEHLAEIQKSFSDNSATMSTQTNSNATVKKMRGFENLFP